MQRTQESTLTDGSHSQRSFALRHAVQARRRGAVGSHLIPSLSQRSQTLAPAPIGLVSEQLHLALRQALQARRSASIICVPALTTIRRGTGSEGVSFSKPTTGAPMATHVMRGVSPVLPPPVFQSAGSILTRTGAGGAGGAGAEAAAAGAGGRGWRVEAEDAPAFFCASYSHTQKSSSHVLKSPEHEEEEGILVRSVAAVGFALPTEQSGAEYSNERSCVQPTVVRAFRSRVQCRLTAGIPTILLEQKVLGQPFSKDNSTSIVIHTTCTRTYTYQKHSPWNIHVAFCIHVIQYNTVLI